MLDMSLIQKISATGFLQSCATLNSILMDALVFFQMQPTRHFSSEVPWADLESGCEVSYKSFWLLGSMEAHSLDVSFSSVLLLLIIQCSLRAPKLVTQTFWLKFFGMEVNVVTASVVNMLSYGNWTEKFVPICFSQHNSLCSEAPIFP